MLKVLLATASVCVLAGCSSGTDPSATKADITKVANVKSSFGPEYKVTDISERAIDPKLLSARKLPDGLTFDPANCAKVAGGAGKPPPLRGNTGARSAPGKRHPPPRHPPRTS